MCSFGEGGGSRQACRRQTGEAWAAKPGANTAGKKEGAKRAPATGSIESVVVDLLKANGAPMAVPEILATIKKKKLVKSEATNFDGVLRQAMSKSSKIKRVEREIYRA